MDSIIVELSNGVIERYTQSRIFGRKQPGDLLSVNLKNLQEKLQNEGIFLPSVFFCENSELSNNYFKIYSGIKNELYNIRSCELFGALADIAKSYMIDGCVPTFDILHSLANKGHNALQRRNGENEAMGYYDKFVYWLSWALINEHYELQDDIISVLHNVVYIHYVNNRDRNLNEALRFAGLLLDVVDGENFYSPVIRYDAHTLYAKLLWINDEHGKALSAFRQAFHDVENANQPELLLLALWNIIGVCFAEGEVISPLCLEAFNIMDNLIRTNKNLVSQEYFEKITQLHLDVERAARIALAQENLDLTQIINKQQQIISEQSRKLSMVNLACTFASTVGRFFIYISAATPKSITNNNIDNINNIINSIVDNGSTVVGKCFRN